MVLKFIINTCYGGFGLSPKATGRLKDILDEQGRWPLIDRLPDEDNENYDYRTVCALGRDDTALVQVVEELGTEASGQSSQLEVIAVEIDPKDFIEEQDGYERVTRYGAYVWKKE